MGQVAEDMAKLVGKVLRDDRDSNASPAKEPMLEAEAGAVPAAEGAAEAEAEAADTTTVENQFSYTPLAQMKAAWQIQLVDNVVVSPVVVNDIALKLETFLWEKAMLVFSKSLMKKWVQPDSGISSITAIDDVGAHPIKATTVVHQHSPQPRGQSVADAGAWSLQACIDHECRRGRGTGALCEWPGR